MSQSPIIKFYASLFILVCVDYLANCKFKEHKKAMGKLYFVDSSLRVSLKPRFPKP